MGMLDFFRKKMLEYALDKISHNPEAMKYMKQTPELCMEAVKRNPHILRYIDKQTPEICRTAFESSCSNSAGSIMSYVRDELQTPEFCTEIVSRYPEAIKKVRPEAQTREMCIRAALASGCYLFYMSEDIVDSVPGLRFAREIANNIVEERCRKEPWEDPWIHQQTYMNVEIEELCLEAVKIDWRLIKKMANPSPAVCVTAIRACAGETEAWDWAVLDRDEAHVRAVFDLYEKTRQNGGVVPVERRDMSARMAEVNHLNTVTNYDGYIGSLPVLKKASERRSKIEGLHAALKGPR